MRKKLMIAAVLNLLWTAAILIMCWRVFGVSTSTHDAWRDALGRAEQAKAKEKIQFLNSDYAAFLYGIQRDYLLAIVGCAMGYAGNGVMLWQLAKRDANASKQVNAQPEEIQRAAA